MRTSAFLNPNFSGMIRNVSKQRGFIFGTLIIGALYGRTRPDEDDDECGRLVCVFRDRFIEAFGYTPCFKLRENGYGSDGQWPCSTLVERSARILLEVLAEGGG